MKKTFEERFWAKVNKAGPTPSHMPDAGPCWEWMGGLSEKGYGYFYLPGDGHTRQVKAHRYAWKVSVDPELRRSTPIDHMCFNRSCVRLSHMREGSHGVNAQNLSGAQSNSATGVRGVSWSKGDRSFRVNVTASGKSYSRCGFRTVAEAEEAAIQMRRKYMPASLMDQQALAS